MLILKFIGAVLKDELGEIIFSLADVDSNVAYIFQVPSLTAFDLQFWSLSVGLLFRIFNNLSAKVKLGPFGSFEDTLSPGQLGRIPRGGGAVLVAGSAMSGGVGGNATVGGGDGYFGGGHLRLRGGLAKGPRGGLTRGGDVELQGGIGAGSDSGKFMHGRE